MTDLEKALAQADGNLDACLQKLLSLIRIESVSTDSAFKSQCAKAADFLVDELNDIGFSAKKYPTQGHPMVVAQYEGESGAKAPHALFYGHYDVQPADPLDLWESKPFEPDVIEKDGRKIIRGRGASDDKGQLMTFLGACRAWMETKGELPCKITILFEGEEESSSPSLQPFLDEHGDLIKADFALVCDTNMLDRETPAIATSLRGMTSEEITIHCANRDLHSGYYGGAAQNPIHVLSDILAKLHDENGRVTLDGFYEGVSEIDDETRARWSELGYDDESILGEIGLKFPAGEKGYNALEQVWARPTAEVNGICGGYIGEGFKTVIAAQASAKISFRLVGEQDPEKIVASLHAHVEKHLPEDCSATYREHGRNAALQLDPDLPHLRKAAKALSDEWGRETALIAMGGSIPIVGSFKRRLGMDSLLIGFGLSDDNIHSPNEKYDMESFRKGTRSWVRILDALAQ